MSPASQPRSTIGTRAHVAVRPTSRSACSRPTSKGIGDPSSSVIERRMANSRAALSRAGSMAVLNITLPELPPGYLEVLKGTLDVQARRSPRGMPPRRVSISLPTLALRPAKSSEEDTSVNEQPMPLDLAEPREGERRRRRHKRTPKEPKGTMNFEQASLRPGCLSDRLTAYLPTCLSTSQPVWPSHCPTPPHPSRRPTPPDPTSYHPTSPHDASP